MTMRLFAPYTTSHSALANRFQDSFQDHDISVEMVQLSTLGAGGGNFQSESWRNAVIEKQQLIMAKIKECEGDILICSDVDIQFFRPIRPIIESVMESGTIDIAFQAERPWPGGGYNAGFIVMRCNPNVLALYEEMNSADIRATYLMEQDWLNRNLDRFPVIHTALPPAIWAWTHGPHTISRDIVLHHANGTVGGSSIAEKFEQLDYVRDHMLNGKHGPH